MLTIITTVGLSLVYNYQKPAFKRFVEKELRRKFADLLDSPKRAYEVERLGHKNTPILSNESINPIRSGEKRGLDRLEDLLYGVKATRNSQKLPAWTISDEKGVPNDAACAETQTIYEIVKQHKVKEVKLVFLASDTFLSVFVADLLKTRYQNFDIQLDDGEEVTVADIVIREKVVGLQVLDNEKFEGEGFSNLVRLIRKHSQLKEGIEKAILNVSGGYKMIIPPLTIFGQLLGVDIAYIYENSETLIELKQLPINFDTSIVETYGPFIQQDYHKVIEIKLESERKIIEELLDYKILYPRNFKGEDCYMLSNWGKLLRSAIQSQQAMGSSSLGYIAEFLLYHFFCKNPVNQLGDFSNWEMLHGERIHLKDKKKKKSEDGKVFYDTVRDYDMIFHQKNTNLILTEVKALYRVENHFEKVKKGILERLEEFYNQEYNTKFCDPKEFHLAVWKMQEPQKSFIPIFEKLRQFKQELTRTYPKLIFRAYCFK